MLSKKITSRYAKALFDTAREMNLLDTANHDMNLVYEVCRSNDDFMRLLQNPVIRQDKKKSIIDAIFTHKTHKLSILFLHVILRQGRANYIMEIAAGFIRMYKESQGIKTVYVQSALELDTELRNKLKEAIHKQIKYDIELVETTNDKLIGGFVLKIDHTLYDASIASKLRKIEKQISIYE